MRKGKQSNSMVPIHLGANWQGLRSESLFLFIWLALIALSIGLLIVFSLLLFTAIKENRIVLFVLLAYVAFVGLMLVLSEVARQRFLFLRSKAKAICENEDGLVCPNCLYLLGRTFSSKSCPECGVPLDRNIVRANWSTLYSDDLNFMRKLFAKSVIREIRSPLMVTQLLFGTATIFFALAINSLFSVIIGGGAILALYDETAEQIALFLALGLIAVLITLLAGLMKQRIHTQFANGHYLRCWACARPIPDTDRGTCEHCGTPWERRMLVHAWKRRFNVKDTNTDH